MNITRIGKIEENEIAGYYCINSVHDPYADFLYSIFSDALKDLRVGQANSLEEIAEGCQQRSSVENLHVYIIPHKLGESYSDTINRILNTEKCSVPGKYEAGKFTWSVPRPPLDSKYAVCVPDEDVTIASLRDKLKPSILLRLVTEGDAFPFMMSRQLVRVNFIPDEVVACSRDIQYRKGNGKLVTLPKNRLGQKLARSRGLKEFVYDENVSVPLLVKDFVEKKLVKGSMAEHVLSSKYLPNVDTQEIEDSQIQQSFAYLEKGVEVRRFCAIDGFDVRALIPILQDNFIAVYAGEFDDLTNFPKGAVNYSYWIDQTSGIRWSQQQAVCVLERGNFTGFINHATGDLCNVVAKRGFYRGLMFAVLVAKKDIASGAQLLLDYSSVIFDDDRSLIFTSSGGIEPNDACKTLVKKVKEEGRAALSDSRPEYAKRKFKQANALSPSNAWTEYYLGLTYCTLAKKEIEKKAKYYLRAQSFFAKTKEHSSTYNELVDKQEKLIPEPYQLRK